MKLALLVLLSSFIFTTSLGLQAAKPTLKDLGNPKAPKGGTFYRNFNAEPETLNPLTSSDIYASYLHGYVVDGLTLTNPETYEQEPALAHKFEESKDGKSITYYIRKSAVFHDGKPITAKDVKFSFDALMDSKFNTAHKRPYYENIEKAEIIDKHTVKFHVKKPYFGNLLQLGSLNIVPHHVYKDPKKKLNKKIIASGPYKIKKYNKGKSIILERNNKWWGYTDPSYKNSYNFKKILIRFVKEPDVALQMLQKGRIDYIVRMTPEQYAKKSSGKMWGKTVFKKKVKNKSPKSYSYIGWNQKNDLFKNKKIRKALTQLMNRDLMNKKFRYNMSYPATGPWYKDSPYADKTVKAVGFNSKLAGAALKKAGWKDSDKDGVLDKTIKGKKRKFSFTLMYGTATWEKYLTIFKEQLKKNGIDVQLKKVEWNSLVKALNEKKFDAVLLGWGGGSVHLDPKQIWHSTSARKGGSNYISYSNPKVDKLIDQGRKIMNNEKRMKVFKKVYKLIAEDHPYTFLFSESFDIYAVTKKIQQDKLTYQYRVDSSFWWATAK